MGPVSKIIFFQNSIYCILSMSSLFLTICFEVTVKTPGVQKGWQGTYTEHLKEVIHTISVTWKFRLLSSTPSSCFDSIRSVNLRYNFSRILEVRLMDGALKKKRVKMMIWTYWGFYMCISIVCFTFCIFTGKSIL